MFASDNAGTIADAAVLAGRGNNNDGFGGNWWPLFFLFAMMGWGGYGMGGGMGGNMGAFPWLLYGQQGINTNMNNGFDNAAVMTGINGVQNAVTTGFGGVQTALCSGFAGVNANVANGFAQAEIANNARQVSYLQGMNGIQSQLAQCCCDNRLGTESLRATVLQENCQDRYEAANNTRDIIDNANRNNQALLDKLCQLELDNYKRENDALRTQLNMANLAASQNAQTATISAGQRALANEIEQYVVPRPVPAYTVQNPNCCTQNFGCGCGA